jgi:DNA-binding transcriptional LysR family regulator
MAERRLQVFQAVVKHGSFTRAAEALFMSQPSVTFQIRQLEEQYRVRLLERNTGNVTPTPAGELVLDYANRILALSDELDARMAEMTDLMRGTLVVAACSTVGGSLMPALLGEFNARFPQVRARLSVANSDAVTAKVAARQAHVGIVDMEPAVPGVTAAACGYDDVVAVFAPDHPLARAQKVRAAALAEYEFLAREPGSGTRAAGEAWFAAQGIAVGDLKVQMELGNPESLLELAASGLGFALASRRTAMAAVEAKRLRAVRLEPPLRRPLYLILPDERFRPRLVDEFSSMAGRYFKDNAA